MAFLGYNLHQLVEIPWIERHNIPLLTFTVERLHFIVFKDFLVTINGTLFA